jgi:hypothetical protein
MQSFFGRQESMTTADDCISVGGYLSDLSDSDTPTSSDSESEESDSGGTQMYQEHTNAPPLKRQRHAILVRIQCLRAKEAC